MLSKVAITMLDKQLCLHNKDQYNVTNDTRQ